MRFLIVIALLGLGLGYYFRDEIAPGWLGPGERAGIQAPSAMGSIGRTIDKSF
jgi:hypothetical protein